MQSVTEQAYASQMQLQMAHGQVPEPAASNQGYAPADMPPSNAAAFSPQPLPEARAAGGDRQQDAAAEEYDHPAQHIGGQPAASVPVPSDAPDAAPNAESHAPYKSPASTPAPAAASEERKRPFEVFNCCAVSTPLYRTCNVGQLLQHIKLPARMSVVQWK